MLAFVVAYFFLPYDVRAWIPVWLPFLAALGLEVQFFLGGYRAAQRGDVAAPERDRGPQPRDLEELGWQLQDENDGDVALDEEERDAPEYEPYEERRRPSRRNVAEALAALAVVAAVLAFAALRPQGWTAIAKADRAKAEAAFSLEATRIAGHPSGVVCDTAGEHVGVVQEADGAAEVGGNVAYLVPSLCDELYQLRFKHRVRSFSRTARAIAVLAHEAWHLRGVADEGLANCYAFQSGVDVGVRLGLSESRAHAMMREQLATNAADSADVRYLVPPECRNGGRYDLRPNSSRFP